MSFFKKLLKVSSGTTEKEQRDAYRVEIPLLRAKLSGKPVSVSVRDLSASGISFNSMAREFTPGNRVLINLFRGHTLLAADLSVVIVRVGKGYVGGRFETLSRRQSDVLHAVTLEEQKKLADITKKDGRKPRHTAEAEV